MNRNPLIPFATIAIIGVLLMIGMSFYGVNKSNQIASEKQGGGAKQEQPVDPKAIVSQTCSSCHGADLSGNVGPDLTKIGAKYSSAEIKDILMNGKGSGMPGGLLDDASATKVADWLAEKK